MNFIVDKGLTATATQAFDAADSVTDQRNATLARLMKAWESKNARSAKRVGAFGFMAVTLAACGSSSDSDDDNGGGDNGGGDNGGGDNGGGTTPVPPALVEPDFFVLDFPTQTVETTVFNIDGQPVSVEDALAAFADLAAVDLPDGESITIDNLNVVQEAIGGDGFGSGDGENTINIGGAGSDQQLSFDEFLDLLQTQDIITVGRVILTPQENSGIVFAPGFATGDQFTEGEFGTAGNPGSGDDVIFIGRTELLHAAILDGGGGADELVIVAKGNYAQPSAIRSIETVRILNSENTTVDVLSEVAGKNILTEEDVNFQIVSTFPTFNSPTDDENTWIDLGAAFGLSSVVIGENAGVTDSNLFVVGVNNGATLVLQGGIENDVAVSYGFNFGGTVFNLRLEDVNFDGGDLLIAQNSTHLAIESTGAEATVENFIENGDFGGNLRQLTITGDKFLHIDGGVEFNDGRAITIDAGANTGGVKLDADHDGGDSIAENTINLIGSQGDDDFTLVADAFNITSGEGNNTFDLTGSYDGDLVSGMRLVFDGSAGEDTIVLNGDNGPLDFNVMLGGSSISGSANTLVLNTNYSLTEASVEGLDAVQMAPGATLALTPAQIAALGADVFSDVDGDENVASVPTGPLGTQVTPVLAIVMDADATLSDLIDVSALDSGVKLAFRIPEGVTLTLTAEELHEYVASPGILMGNDDTNPLESVGNLVITDAGQNFDPYDAADVDVPGLGLVPEGGTVAGSTNNVEIIRSEDGFNRPSQVELDDALTIDSSDGPVEVGPNDFGNDDEFTIPQTDTLIMTGENDITFTAPVSFDGQTGFTIDFSEVEGVVSGLEIVDFHNITPGTNTDDWGQVIGNGDARIDVQLDGNVGNSNNGLISSGVATYVVTDLNDGDHQFWTSDPTEDLEVLGLQGNDGDTITFGNVRNGVNFLMEGDGFATFDDVPKALEPLDESNIGTLEAIFAAGSGTVSAVVDINNQGVELGAASDGGLRVLNVDGIDIDGAQTVTINVADGDASIESIAGDDLEDVVITSENDVSLTLDDNADDLESIDATGVVGEMTLVIGENETVDLSEAELSGIDAITMMDQSDLTLTVEQALDFGIGNINVDGADDGNTATLTLNVTEDFNIDDLDVTNLPEGLTLELSLQSEVELNITGDQLADLLEAGVAITDGSGGDPAGTLNVTGFTQANLEDADGNTFVAEYAAILADAPAIAGTITTDGSDIYVPSDYGAFPGLFAWELEGGALGISVQGMADGLVVNNGDVQFYFVPNFAGGATINAEDYTDIGTVFINEFGLPDPFNVENITFLDSDTEVEIVPLVSPEFDGVDRTLIVGGVPFAIDDGTGAPFNPGTGDAGPVTTGVNLDFDNVSGDSNRNVETVTIAFQEGGNIVGAITIGDGELPGAGNTFEALTLISNGDDVNTIEGDISAPGGNNNLLTVNIQANQDLVIGDDPVAPTTGTIILSSVDAGADATVTITGTEDVTVKGIDATDPNIATLTVDTLGHSGTYTLAGGSPSIDAGETLFFVGGVDSTVELDTADLTPPDDGNLGVDGNGVLELLDASGMEGTLSLGDVGAVADGFELIGGTGVITANVTLPANNYSIDIGNAAAGSAITLGDDILTAGSVSLATDPDTNETTLTFGDNTVLEINSEADLSLFDNVVFGDNVELVLGEDGLVSMDDDTFAAFEAAGGTITGETAKTFDEGVDLTDVRGLTEINIEEGADTSSDPFTLSSDQIAIARIVDTDGNPVSDFGDIQAINTELGGDFAIVVKEDATFEVTDNEIDGIAISGDGEVITTIEGTAGATLNVDTGAGDNLPGQSITVNYTLDGVAGSVVLNNTATDFTSAPSTEASLAGTLDAVAGLNASATSGQVVVATDEPGVEFVVTSVDTSGTNGMDIGDETFVNSTAGMSGNTVEDTTHVFPTLGTPAFYTVTGTLGGDETIEIEGDNFIDLTGTPLPSGADQSINLTGGVNLELKLNPNDLSGLIVTGDGSVQADLNGTINAPDLSEIDVPLQFNVAAANTGINNNNPADPAAQFNPNQPLTLVDVTGVPAPGPVFDITGINGANDVPVTNRPSEVILDNVDLTLTAAQGDGLVVSGASEVTVILDPTTTDDSSNTDLSGMDVPVEIEATGDTDFGGNLPSGQPITFSSSGGSHTITLNGNTIPAGAVISIAADTTLDVTGGTLGAGVSFEMDETSSLTITGAQADGTSIITVDGNGDPDAAVPASVTLTDVQAGQDLSGIAIGGTLTVAFDDDTETEFTLPASAVAGNTVNVENVNAAGSIDTLTITGVEDSDADFIGLEITSDGGAGDVVLELDSTGDHEIGADADFGITSDGASGDVTLAISGTGSVTVDGGADLTGIDAYTVDAGSTLVADASVIGDAVVDTSLVTGEGTLEHVNLDTATVTATGDVRFNDFVFDSGDAGVTINDFEAVGALDGFFIFDAGPVLGAMSLDLSSFDTTGTGFDTIPDNAATTDLAGIGVIVVENGDDPVNMDFSGDNGINAQLFLVSDQDNDGDAEIEYWDDAGGNGDGIVDLAELTEVASLTSTDPDQLGSENFTL